MFVEKVTSPMESHKDFFVDPRAPKRLVLSVPLCCTSKTSSRGRSLRMTCLGGVRGKRMLARAALLPAGEGFIGVRVGSVSYTDF